MTESLIIRLNRSRILFNNDEKPILGNNSTENGSANATHKDYYQIAQVWRDVMHLDVTNKSTLIHI